MYKGSATYLIKRDENRIVLLNRLENKWSIHDQTIIGWTRHCSNSVRWVVNSGEIPIEFINS